MKTKTLSIILLSLFLLLSACSPITTIVNTDGEQPTPVVEHNLSDSGYQNVTVDEVEVEIGVGSPIPVFVHVSGNLPDPCSQVEHTEIKQDGSNFIISLYATPDIGGPALDGCIKDPIPFTMSIPLSVVDLPAGAYTVTVNGSSANFELDTENTTSSLPQADRAIEKMDIGVDDVNVEIGIGSPAPVHAIVSANLPNACAQLGEVRIHRDETTFFVQLLAYAPAQTDCNPDTLPMRIEIPLNILAAPEGPYEVNVNGVTTSFDPRTDPAEGGEAIIPNEWVTYTSSNPQCGYAISYPPEMQVIEQTEYSQLFGFKLPDSDAGIQKFVYVSVVTPEVQNMVSDGTYEHDVYTYDSMAMDILLKLQVGESKSVHQVTDLESWFTFERKPDAQISGQVVQVYENQSPWEFSDGTKEIRYILSLEGCTYLIGGFIDIAPSGEPGEITESLFQQIVATVQVAHK